MSLRLPKVTRPQLDVQVKSGRSIKPNCVITDFWKFYLVIVKRACFFNQKSTYILRRYSVCTKLPATSSWYFLLDCDNLIIGAPFRLIHTLRIQGISHSVQFTICPFQTKYVKLSLIYKPK